MAVPAVYRPRNPQDADYYRFVEDYLETFMQGYEDCFEWNYGFLRPYLQKVIYRYPMATICTTFLPTKKCQLHVVINDKILS